MHGAAADHGRDAGGLGVRPGLGRRAAGVANAQPSHEGGQTEIVRADFGTISKRPAGKESFAPTRTVDTAVAGRYGWVMVVRTAQSTLHFREVLTLPAPAEWGVDPNTTVSTDKTTAVTERDAAVTQGLIINLWAVSPGDPKGRYVIKVTVENGIERVFAFDVK